MVRRASRGHTPDHGANPDVTGAAQFHGIRANDFERDPVFATGYEVSPRDRIRSRRARASGRLQAAPAASLSVVGSLTAGQKQSRDLAVTPFPSTPSFVLFSN